MDPTLSINRNLKKPPSQFQLQPLPTDAIVSPNRNLYNANKTGSIQAMSPQSGRLPPYADSKMKSPKGSLVSKFSFNELDGDSIIIPRESTTRIARSTPLISKTEEPNQPRLAIVTKASEMPTPTLLSQLSPDRKYDQPPHRFPNRVDSRMQAKTVSLDTNSSPGKPLQLGPPKYFGTTYVDSVNAPFRPKGEVPPNATLPRIYTVPTQKQFSSLPMIHNRSPDGKILGTVTKRFVPDVNVPYLPPDEPVGPDNPVKELNETWTACWDDEAGAIYYYNKITGEATWIPPD